MIRKFNQGLLYKANPSTLKTSGPWSIDAERANSRAAMVGLVAMLVLEKAIGGPVTGRGLLSSTSLLNLSRCCH